jgi:hypothetical protein
MFRGRLLVAGTFSSLFTDLVGMPSCVAKRVTKPIRNREAPVTEPQLV